MQAPALPCALWQPWRPRHQLSRYGLYLGWIFVCLPRPQRGRSVHMCRKLDRPLPVPHSWTQLSALLLTLHHVKNPEWPIVCYECCVPRSWVEKGGTRWCHVWSCLANRCCPGLDKNISLLGIDSAGCVSACPKSPLTRALQPRNPYQMGNAPTKHPRNLTPPPPLRPTTHDSTHDIAIL